MMKLKVLLLKLLLFTTIAVTHTSDITNVVFGKFLDGMPAAFGDFNSDELTDVFVLTNNSKTLTILLASDQEPLLHPTNWSCPFNHSITNVAPGDFDGDVFMDILITTQNDIDKLTDVYILWGGVGALTCPNEALPLFRMKGQPLTIDYNQDMIIDLFGSDEHGHRVFWVFNGTRGTFNVINMTHHEAMERIKEPHSNAFLDLNGDFLPDLMVTTEKYFEIWYAVKNGFQLHEKIPLPPRIDVSSSHVGQSLYLDVELKGKLDLVVPICYDSACKDSAIAIHNGTDWHTLQIDFHPKDKDNTVWGFVPPKENYLYTDTITLRGGDFNMDGYPDLLATLQTNDGSMMRSFLLKNIPCETNNCDDIDRTFEVMWTGLTPFVNETAMAVFYDFYQDGILDVILVEYDKNKKLYHARAFKNNLDLDANFVTVMVLTGITNPKYPISPGSLGKKKRTYGTNLPGPSIAYNTKTQDGNPQNAIAAQLPQSAHFSLNLPYTTFGLGRTPNFIDTLTIGVAKKSRAWPQIIPNSQMVVIPNPIDDPSRWKTRLFVTPSKLILLSAAALTATCVLISAIIIALYWKERREDKIERLQEAHRFHFDAM